MNLAFIYRRHGDLQIGESGQQDPGSAWAGRRYFCKHLDAVHALHSVVRYDDVEISRFERSETLLGADGGFDAEVVSFEHPLQRVEDFGLIVDNENPGRYGAVGHDAQPFRSPAIRGSGSTRECFGRLLPFTSRNEVGKVALDVFHFFVKLLYEIFD